MDWEELVGVMGTWGGTGRDRERTWGQWEGLGKVVGAPSFCNYGNFGNCSNFGNYSNLDDHGNIR